MVRLGPFGRASRPDVDRMRARSDARGLAKALSSASDPSDRGRSAAALGELDILDLKDAEWVDRALGEAAQRDEDANVRNEAQRSLTTRFGRGD